MVASEKGLDRGSHADARPTPVRSASSASSSTCGGRQILTGGGCGLITSHRRREAWPRGHAPSLPPTTGTRTGSQQRASACLGGFSPIRRVTDLPDRGLSREQQAAMRALVAATVQPPGPQHSANDHASVSDHGCELPFLGDLQEAGADRTKPRLSGAVLARRDVDNHASDQNATAPRHTEDAPVTGEGIL